MALDETDLDALVAEAAAILDEAAKPFVAGHRADSAVPKKGNDFATEVDLAIERQVVDALVPSTGIGVHGEEFGGADVDSPLVWVLDPIDGTFNYAAGSPMAAILLGLVRDGEPVAGLTWLPFTDQRYTAVVGKPLYANGRCAATAGAGQAGRLHRRHQHLQHRLPRTVPRALPARRARAPEPGVLADADARRHRHRPGLHRGRDPRRGNQLRRSIVWDHAAGVALVRAAGGIVTDLAGSAWTIESRRRWPRRPACTASFSRSCGPSAIRRTTDEPRRPRGSHHPVPGRRRRPGGQGRQLRKPARRRRSRRTGRGLRRRGCRRADIPGRDGVVVGPGHHARGRQPHRRAGVHPADRRRRRALGGRRRRAAARGRRQGRGQHRRHRPAGTAGRAVPSVRVAVHRAVGRRPHRAARARSRRRRAGRSPPTAAGAARVSTPSNGRRAEPNSASARSC